MFRIPKRPARVAEVGLVFSGSRAKWEIRRDLTINKSDNPVIPAGGLNKFSKSQGRHGGGGGRSIAIVDGRRELAICMILALLE